MDAEDFFKLHPEYEVYARMGGFTCEQLIQIDKDIQSKVKLGKEHKSQVIADIDFVLDKFSQVFGMFFGSYTDEFVNLLKNYAIARLYTNDENAQKIEYENFIKEVNIIINKIVNTYTLPRAELEG